MRMGLERLLVFAVLAACPQCLSAQAEAEARRGYDENMRAFERLAVECDARAAGALFTPDAKFVDDGERVANGRAEIQQLWRHDCAAVTVKSWTYETQQFGHSGPIAYGSGITRATYVDKQSGKEQKQAEHFLALLRRQPDGKWARFQEIWAPVKEERSRFCYGA